MLPVISDWFWEHMNDNGNTINIAGNVFNSGIHAGAGKVALNGTSSAEY